MRCEDVQLELARDAVTPSLREAVAAHVEGCPACREVHLMYIRLTALLRTAPTWEPPEGFARMVAIRVSQAEPRAVSMKDHVMVHSLVEGATVSVLVGLAAYVGARLLVLLTAPLAGLAAPTLTTVWVWVGFSYCLAASVARRARA